MGESYEGKTFAECSDEEVGRWVKELALKIEEWAGKEWPDKNQLTFGLLNMCLLQAVKAARDTNAGTIDYDLDGVTIGGEDAGDWKIIIKQKRQAKAA